MTDEAKNYRIPEPIVAAIMAGTTYTVTRTDGHTFTGIVVPHESDPEYIRVVTGRRGRPAIIHVDDVTEVSTER